jgi:hypothetical protein
MATYYPAAGTGSANWNSAASWSASQGGAGGVGVPTTAIDVIIEGAVGTHVFDIALDSATADVCKTLTCQNVASSTNNPTLTFTNNDKCIVSGNVTIGASYAGLTASGGILVMHAAGALTTNGVTIPCPLTYDATATYTISGAAVVTGLVTLGGYNMYLNYTTAEATDTLTCNGGATLDNWINVGTAKLVIGGGTLQSTNATNPFRNDIDLAGSVTIGTIMTLVTKTLAYVSGTITTTSSSLYICGSCTLNTPTANMHWNNIICSTTGTLTLTAAITLDGAVAANSGQTLTLATSNLTCAGIDTTTTGIIAGQTITLSGGTWQSTGWTTGYVSSNISLAGTVTISGNVGYRTNTITYTSGTITTTNSTLNVSASCTLTTPSANMHWNNITTGTTSAINCTSGIILDGVLTQGSGTVGVPFSRKDVFGII